MDRRPIIKNLKEYKKKVSKNIKIDKMIFFGSRAKGKPKKHSDIDLIIVSSSFKKIRFIKRPFNLYKEWDLDYPVDILCYTPKEIRDKKQNKGSIISEALSTGIEV